MNNFLEKFIAKYGYKNTVCLFLYPIVLPFLMIKETSASIFNIISGLINCKWKYLSGNDERNALNNYFYYVQDLNVQKFGRYGTAGLMGGGNYSLKNLFHITPVSLRFQSCFGTTFMLFFSMCFWGLSFALIYQDSPNLWLLVLVVFSTLFFASFIEVQNYNILGWMFFPILLSVISDSQYLALITVLCCISFCSFTGFFVAAILVFVSGVYLEDWLMILTIAPGALLWGLPVFISLGDGALAKILGILGGYGQVKYKRSNRKIITISKLYLIGLQLCFFITSFFLQETTLLLVLLGMVIFLFFINAAIFRFADEGSFYIAYLSVSLAYVLQNDISVPTLSLYLLSIFPVYGLVLDVLPEGGSFISPGKRRPVDTSGIYQDFVSLFKSIPDREQVLVAYKNPEGEYSNLFVGYRGLQEILQYSAVSCDVSIVPDWYTVFENNKFDSDESFWVNDQVEALKYMAHNCISYVVVPDAQCGEWSEFELVDKCSVSFDSTKPNDSHSFSLMKVKI